MSGDWRIPNTNCSAARNFLPEVAVQALLDDPLAAADGGREAGRSVAREPALASRSSVAKPANFTRVIIDTTLQPRAITFPTHAKLLQRARERLVKLAHNHDLKLRQSYLRVGRVVLIRHQRYAHTKQFKRANRALKTLRTYLGRVTRDIDRKIAGDNGLKAIFAHPLQLARRVREQRQRSAGPRSTVCMRWKWNASAKASLTPL